MSEMPEQQFRVMESPHSTGLGRFYVERRYATWEPFLMIWFRPGWSGWCRVDLNCFDTAEEAFKWIEAELRGPKEVVRWA